MRLSIFTKLFVSILFVCVAMLAVMTLTINTNFKKGLQSYLNNKEVAQAELLAERVKAYYSDSYGWIRIEQSPHIWAGLIEGIGQVPPRPDAMPRQRNHPVRQNRADSIPETAFVPAGLRMNLLDSNGQPVIGFSENLDISGKDKNLTRVEIKRDGKLVGYVSIVQSNELSGELVESFFEQQTNSVFITASVTILFSFVIAFFLVRLFLKPLSKLSDGAQRIEKGELDFTIETNGSDELADLIRTFNGVIESLKNQKESRAQWLSDISHELRTPIAVLRSELEAIQDGIRKPEPQYIDSLHKQVTTLGKLVEDLHLLSLSDAGSVIDPDVTLDLSAVLDSVTFSGEVRLSQKGISVERHFDTDKAVFVKGDEKALIQLFTNLLENTYRYTDEKGRVTVSLEEKQNAVHVSIEDSSPGVPDASLSRLFDRLYRVDKSRSRASGGSGLGLSICQNIVKAHNGTIIAEHSELGGLRILIKLPKVMS